MRKILNNIFITVFFFVFVSSSYANDDIDEKVAKGGRLYDKWWQEYNLKKPASTHPAYPSSGKKKGATTWRCKECHGWDYRGNKGAYNKGSHYTGIKGIRNYSGKPINQIVKILKDKNHQYDSVMLDRALQLIAQFVSKGQVDTTRFIDDKTKKAKGDVNIGKHIFADKCVRCHGLEGKDINFGDILEPEFVGTVASKNPWEAVHKIYNGHPGSEMGPKIMHSNRQIHQRHHMGLIKPRESMPYMRNELSETGILHLLTYIQTLPAE
ncbi:MAG: cytochrome c [Gammaproteobacteria bacterium]|nr:cytochrome c [Gammaproteobacteria bacterium]